MLSRNAKYEVMEMQMREGTGKLTYLKSITKSTHNL
jgi:hypothetical protein